MVVIVAAVVVVAVAFAVPAAAADMDTAEVVDLGGVSSRTVARDEGQNRCRCCTKNIMQTKFNITITH